MSTWKDRLAPGIYFTSPSGLWFEAAWSGNQRTMEKKLGIFEYPKVKGATVQDLDVGAIRYPLTFYFEGPDHDLEAARFFECCKERGTWEVVHPVHGTLILQLMSVTEHTQPVTSANVTEMDSEWIEPLLDNPLVSVPQLEAEITWQIENVLDRGGEQFAGNLDRSSPSALAKLVQATMTTVAIIMTIKANIAVVIGVVSTIRKLTLGAVQFTVSMVASLMGLVRSLITLPGMTINDISSRFDYFGKVLGESAKGLTPRVGDAAGRNVAAVHELVALSCLTGIAQSVVEAEFSTRSEALDCLSRLRDLFNTATGNLDAIQTVYADNSIDQQYVSQAQSYNDVVLLMRMVSELLLRRSFDLAVAKRITLRKDRAPVEIAITEGVDLDVLIASNQLKDDEILLLAAGREIVVYL